MMRGFQWSSNSESFWVRLILSIGTPGSLRSAVAMNTANFIVHLAADHQRQHLPVTHERPERMLESCGPVLFDKEMSRPCQAVTGHKRQRKQPPLADGDQENQQRQRRDRTDGVQCARGR